MLEDAEPDADLVRRELERTGLPFSFERVETEEAFVRTLEDFKPDLVLSDYVLPAYEGLSALAFVREKCPDLPFIFVSWEIHENSVIEALNRGATDYVFKDQISRLTLSVVRAMREAEEKAALKTAQERMAEQERLGALGTMASGIAHDYSNALMPVLGYSELLLNHPETWDDKQKLKYFLEMMGTSAKDAMNMVARLREFYRLRERAEDLFPVDLTEVVEQVARMTVPKWKTETMAKGITVDVRVEMAAHLPKILANDAALREAFTDILFNAVEAMPGGGTVTFRGRPDGANVVLEIADTGAGMTEKVRRHCFEPFFSTKGKGGTGMGLAMVYGVIRRHGGAIRVESAPDKGTKFIIRLPKYDEALLKEKAPLPAQKKIPAAVRPLRVLVVDDEPSVLKIIREYLAMDGHAAEGAVSVDEGFEKFSRQKFDLVITDWAMPQKNGDELIARVRQTSPQTPIILLTGFGALVGEDKARSADLLLSKPVTIEAMREAIWTLTGSQ